MTSGQRKAHKYVWLLLVMTIPILMIFAVKDLDVFSLKEDLKPKFSATKGTIVKTSENKILKASLIKKDSLYSLEVILKKPIKQASLVIESLQAQDGAKVIGQLSSVGIYKFEVDEVIEAIILKDPLGKEDINILTVLPL
ncbi:hypothetical protein [Spongiivirga citrea]|uniref:Uncharacterized protein n=1 Tax=Spongiivirga citrea TaxID=1481457 RepID=A0A6M0CE49_9FLAO|nr:hypothetical protein [Spongiivirga citrea]NER16085.1 hypothetical protein [Spongiivirga citrea]